MRHPDVMPAHRTRLGFELSLLNKVSLASAWLAFSLRVDCQMLLLARCAGGVADRVLLKPGKLTPEERVAIERHTLVGFAALQTISKRFQPTQQAKRSAEVL